MCAKNIFSGFFWICLLASPAWAAEPLQPRAEIGLKAGTDRSLMTTEFWAPLAQQNDRVLYGDIRLMGDNDENREGNLGFGYRQINPYTNSVTGGHIWIDRRRTQNNSNFHQATFGAESLGHTIDLRANGYIPLNGSRTLSGGSVSAPYLAGAGIFYDINGFVVETPQYGMDSEIGYRLPVLQKQIDAFRVYGGGYHFFRNNTDNVTGIRFRAEAQINKAVSVGARFQHDAERGSQGFLEATLKFPFSAKKLYQTDSLRSRLDESPERDVDIVTNTKLTAPETLLPVFNTITGVTQRVLYVDNTNASVGDGTKENPFNTLKAAEAILQDNDIVYLNYGDGTVTGQNQGIVINKTNVQLIGSGSNFIYDGGTFTTETGIDFSGNILAAAGTAPIITNTQARTTEYAGNGVLVTADNAFVSGITVTGTTNNGILAAADGVGKVIDQITISNVTTNANARRGIFVSTINGGTINTAIVENSTSNGNLQSGTGRGIDIRADGGTINTAIIRGNTTQNNIQNGIISNTLNSGLIGSITFENNTSSLNGGAGIAIGATTLGRINTITTTDNITSGNTNFGLHNYANTGGTIGDISIQNNTATYNTNDNISVLTGDASIIDTVTLNNNVVTHSGINGLQINTANSSRIGTVSINTLTSDLNTQNGILVVVNATSTIGTINLQNITANNNTQDGIRFNNFRTINTINASNITVTGNRYGFYVFGGATGTPIYNQINLTGITATSNLNGIMIAPGGTSVINNLSLTDSVTHTNTGYGIQFALSTSAVISNAVISNITANTNNQSGIYVLVANSSRFNNASFSNITTNSNNVNGIYFHANNSGQINNTTVTNIIATANGQSGLDVYGQLSTSRINGLSVSNSDFTGNTGNGIYLHRTSASSVYIVDLGGGGTSTGGNRIFGNTGNDLNLDRVTVSAGSNWWNNGGAAPTRVTSTNSGIATYNTPLTADPRP